MPNPCYYSKACCFFFWRICPVSCYIYPLQGPKPALNYFGEQGSGRASALACKGEKQSLPLFLLPPPPPLPAWLFLPAVLAWRTSTNQHHHHAFSSRIFRALPAAPTRRRQENISDALSAAKSGPKSGRPLRARGGHSLLGGKSQALICAGELDPRSPACVLHPI